MATGMGVGSQQVENLDHLLLCMSVMASVNYNSVTATEDVGRRTTVCTCDSWFLEGTQDLPGTKQGAPSAAPTGCFSGCAESPGVQSVCDVQCVWCAVCVVCSVCGVQCV
jgi:hypothetical protein